VRVRAHVLLCLVCGSGQRYQWARAEGGKEQRGQQDVCEVGLNHRVSEMGRRVCWYDWVIAVENFVGRRIAVSEGLLGCPHSSYVAWCYQQEMSSRVSEMRASQRELSPDAVCETDPQGQFHCGPHREYPDQISEGDHSILNCMQDLFHRTNRHPVQGCEWQYLCIHFEEPPHWSDLFEMHVSVQIEMPMEACCRYLQKPTLFSSVWWSSLRTGKSQTMKARNTEKRIFLGYLECIVIDGSSILAISRNMLYLVSENCWLE